MLRKLAVCASLVLALTLTGCANTTTSAADETSVGFDANAKAACSTTTECSAEKKAECEVKKIDCEAKAMECCDSKKDAAAKP
jgi:uncharacterized lipoprotein NlpE involved in copper resistance